MSKLTSEFLDELVERRQSINNKLSYLDTALKSNSISHIEIIQQLFKLFTDSIELNDLLINKLLEDNGYKR